MATNKNKTKNRINKQKEIEQRKRKKRKSMLIKTLIIILLVVIGLYVVISPTFKIQTIIINGNNQLTNEKILELGGVKTGDNIFFKIGKVIEVKLKQSGATEKAKIKKVYPNQIEIEITERQKQFQIKTELENYIYIDRQGYIIGSNSEKLELITITGMKVTEKDAETEKRLSEKDLSKMENILQICEECKKIEILEKITQIQTEEEYIISLEKEGLMINLGNASNLKDKMYYVNKMLQQEAGNSGIIYVNGNLNEGFKPYFSANQN